MTRLVEWLSTNKLARSVPFWILVAIAAGLYCVAFPIIDAAIWALAALSCGWLLGFLFGIPRVQQGAAESDEPYHQIVNTNLSDISDWLTKIIVGLGLVQMNQIPRQFESLVRFLAGTKHDPGHVGSILVFFGVSGFLAGYLLTRLFLARAFSEADQSANRFNEEANKLPEDDVTSETVNAQTSAGENSLPHRLIKDSTRAAVLAAWEQVYSAAREVLKAKEPGIRPPGLAKAVMQKLKSIGLVSEQQASTFEQLRELRNLAAHSMEAGIAEEAALDFVRSAQGLSEYFNAKREQIRAGGQGEQATAGPAPGA
jgi:uncharacterized protein YutE (UPF0331/DUF86 family)